MPLASVRRHLAMLPHAPPLDAELRTLEAQLPALLRDHAGEFVLIHGCDVVGLYATSDDALREGYARFGPDEPFLAQEVAAPRIVSSSALRRAATAGA